MDITKYSKVVVENNIGTCFIYDHADELSALHIISPSSNKRAVPLTRIDFCELRPGNYIQLEAGMYMSNIHYGVFINIVYHREIPFLAYSCPLDLVTTEYAHAGITVRTVNQTLDNILRLVPIDRYIKRVYILTKDSRYILVD